MLIEGHEIARLGRPALGDRNNLVREQRVARRLVDVGELHRFFARDLRSTTDVRSKVAFYWEGGILGGAGKHTTLILAILGSSPALASCSEFEG